jgi:hypothetical protein
MSYVRYSLGANSADGFFSLYDSFADRAEEGFLWVLKGGAGCGKSSFMKMIGAAAERSCLTVEYIHCSGDPDSLDGVYIPALKTAYVDGTAPHVMDTNLTAADSAYLDLGRHYDIQAIAPYREEISRLKKINADCYRKAYRLLNAAGAVRRGITFPVPDTESLSAAKRRMDAIIRREFGKKRGEKGMETRWFLSAITCNGHICFPETCAAVCSRFYHIDAPIGVSGWALDYIAAAARKAGLDIIACPDPLTPEMLEAVLIPSLSLGIVTEKALIPENPQARHVCLAAAANYGRDEKSENRRLKKLEKQLVGEAINMLSQSKKYHDELERVYNPNVDFDGVYEDVAKHLAILGLK